MLSISSKEIAQQYHVSIRTAQRWLKKGFTHESSSSSHRVDKSQHEEIMVNTNQLNQLTIESLLVQNNQILQQQTKLIEAINQTNQTILSMFELLKNQLLGSNNAGDKMATKNDTCRDSCRHSQRPVKSKSLKGSSDIKTTHVATDTTKNDKNDTYSDNYVTKQAQIGINPSQVKKEENKEIPPYISPKETREERKVFLPPIPPLMVVEKENQPTLPVVTLTTNPVKAIKGELLANEPNHLEESNKAIEATEVIKVKKKAKSKAVNYTEDFLEFWQIYPQGKYSASKRRTFKAYLKALEQFEAEKIKMATGLYANSENVKKGYVFNPVKFLNEGIFESFVETVSNPEKLEQVLLDKINWEHMFYLFKDQTGMKLTSLGSKIKNLEEKRTLSTFKEAPPNIFTDEHAKQLEELIIEWNSLNELNERIYTSYSLRKFIKAGVIDFNKLFKDLKESRQYQCYVE